jgi:ABC-type amino acid transport system permease subunit
LIADTFMSFEIWMLVGGMYLVMTIALSTLVGFFERRVRGAR